jgi:hypothetical protein
VLPSEYPELRPWPNLVRLMEQHVDMQVQDIRTMFGLPLPEMGIETGMNFSTGRTVFDLISGASVVFFDASVEAFITRSDRADRFRRLIVCYFPDLSERMPGDRYRALQEEFPVVVPIENPAPDISDLSPEQVADVLWADARNPLTHALGLADPAGETILFLGKSERGMTPAEILGMEDVLGILESYPFTVHEGAQGPEYRIDLHTLYWGVHQMLRKLFHDDEQAARAEVVAAHFFSESAR